jgi:hypothetical protein
MTTVYVILAMIAPALAYELYSLQADVWTISAGFRYLGQEWSLSVPAILSILLGHFYIQPPEWLTLAGYIGEAQEVGVVLWVVYVVYGVDYAVDPSLPWWGYLLFCVAGLCVGAFAWTMGA